jgi:hypothetical protein
MSRKNFSLINTNKNTNHLRGKGLKRKTDFLLSDSEAHENQSGSIMWAKEHEIWTQENSSAEASCLTKRTCGAQL